MPATPTRFVLTAILTLGLGGLLACATPFPAPPLPAPPSHPNGQVLWRLVHDKCVPGQRDHGNPAPCALVSLGEGEPRGFVVLKDREGVAQHLLLPTAKVTGIEDPAVIAADAPDYFAQAWAAKSFVEARLGGPVPREEMSVAVNSVYGRSQDQLHLHVDCLAFEVRDALRVDAPRIGSSWSARPFTFDGHPYRVMRIDGVSLVGASPFRRLARGLPGAAREMGAWTLVLTGARAADGLPGFYLLAARADPARGVAASGEELQDHSCKGQQAERSAPPPRPDLPARSASGQSR
jgi:CDP-diacylglycerol pyrophosphatase